MTDSLPQKPKRVKKYLKDHYPELRAEYSEDNERDFDYITVGQHYKATWVCAKYSDHVWEAAVKDRVRGTNCPYCSNKKILSGFNDLATTRPDLLDEWDFEKNTVNPHRDITSSSNRKGLKIYWKCSKGHSWIAQPYSRSSGNGCPYCANRDILTGFNDLATLRPDLMEEWDWEENTLDPTKDITEYSNARTSWKCLLGHKWEAALSNRSMGNGCPVCSGKKILTGFNDLATIKPELLDEWDYSANEIDPTRDVGPGSVTKVWWKCKEGHTRKQEIYQKKTGYCPKCAGVEVVEGKTDFGTLSPELLLEWDWEKNIGINPMKDITTRSGKRVGWVCSFGHKWETFIYHRTYGTGCPTCLKKGTSRTESEFRMEISKHLDVDLENTKKRITVPGFKNRKTQSVDILANNDLIVEYDGKFYHKDREEYDYKKTKALLDLGYYVVRIREGDLFYLNMDEEYTNFLQISYKYTPKFIGIADKVGIIVDWYNKKKEELSSSTSTTS